MTAGSAYVTHGFDPSAPHLQAGVGPAKGPVAKGLAYLLLFKDPVSGQAGLHNRTEGVKCLSIPAGKHPNGKAGMDNVVQSLPAFMTWHEDGVGVEVCSTL